MGRRLNSRLKSILSYGVVLIMVLFLVHLWQTRDLVEGSAPSLAGHTLHGVWFDLDQQTEWPLLIHFWATWCPVCKLESGGIASLSEDYPVVTIAMQSGSEGEVAAFLDRHKIQLTVINDPDGALAAVWAVRGVPTSYVVDRDGRISYSSVGYTLPMILRLRLWLTEIW